MKLIPSNGYSIVAEKPDDGLGQVSGHIVMAISPDKHQYAVWWRRDEDGLCFNGDYFPVQAFGTLKAAESAAIRTYNERESY